MRLLWANGFGNSATRWYLTRTDPNSADALALLHPVEFGDASPAALPTSALYPETGWAMLLPAA